MLSFLPPSYPNPLKLFPPYLSFPFKTLRFLFHSLSHVQQSQQPIQFQDNSIPEFDSKTVEQTISSYSSDWKSALDFFFWVESHHHFHHNPNTYNRTIDVLAKFFEFDTAWTLIHRMAKDPSCPPDHTIFRTLFKRYASAHLVKEAIDAYEASAEFGLKDKTAFSNLIDALCEYKHVIEAQDLCKESEYLCETKIYNMILRGWFRMGWWSKCREVWEEMGREGVVLDLHSYSIYMDIQCKSGKPWRAVKMYKEMKRKGISLDVVVYNNVIHAVGLSEGVDEAIRMYREMIEFQCQPNVVTYNTIIKLLCKEARIRHAYAFLEQMMKKGCAPDAITYHCFFKCLNRPKEILGLFERMIESGCHPRMETYVMLMKKFGNWGFLRLVFVVWDKMKELGCSPDGFAYNALIDALLQKGMVELARKYDEEMLEKGLSAKPRKELGTKLLNDGGSDYECG